MWLEHGTIRHRSRRISALGQNRKSPTERCFPVCRESGPPVRVEYTPQPASRLGGVTRRSSIGCVRLLRWVTSWKAGYA